VRIPYKNGEPKLAVTILLTGDQIEITKQSFYFVEWYFNVSGFLIAYNTNIYREYFY